ncbi:MAG: hypothetical protein F6J97_23890 [Leptolyngbya sp. SIO4C1]|nr:hypothetical protein [Leptolyngbya sp. SIO4C1]
MAYFGIFLLVIWLVVFVLQIPQSVSTESGADSIPSMPIQSTEALKLEARNILDSQGRSGISSAREIFTKAQKLDPEDPQIAYYLAWLDDLNYSLKDEPDYTPYGNGEPACQSASNRYRSAIQLFNEIQPKDAISQEMIVEIGHYLSNRDLAHRKAIELYSKHILTQDFDLSNPVTYMALVSRGMAYFWLREYENAGADFEQALKHKASNQGNCSGGHEGSGLRTVSGS